MSAQPEFPKDGAGTPSSRSNVTPSSGTGRDEGVPAPLFCAQQRRQTAWLTLGAVALYAAMRALPTGTNLHAVDFSVTGKGALEMCDPANPQFIPVVAVRSPVTMTITPQTPSATAAAGGGENYYLLRLATSSGTPIGPVDLLEVHTRKLHLLIVDDTLGDYQHVHPEPTRTPGEWSFAFAPTRAANYRVFADFTPVVTGRSLYASADVTVANMSKVERDGPARAPNERVGDAALHPSWESAAAGCRFTLAPSTQPIRAGQPVDLAFTITRTDAGAVALEPVMGAFAHLVAFDAERSGFAHLHPVAPDPLAPPDAVRPTLAFKLTIPRAGRYVIWTQVKTAGREMFVPFWFEVAP